MSGARRLRRRASVTAAGINLAPGVQLAVVVEVTWAAELALATKLLRETVEPLAVEAARACLLARCVKHPSTAN